MAGATPMISLRSVSKVYGPVPAVKEVTLDIARGEFFSLLGPSGCGKTTLLRMIGGFEAPTAGDILIDGVSMSGVSPHRRPTNMVFQSYAIFPHFTVGENIGYGLLNKTLSRVEFNRNVTEALDLIQMTPFRDRMPHQLSGGQRQRVALARALVCGPKVLLLDEPLGALDRKLRMDMQIELRRIHQQIGITFVLVTHDQEEALTLSDRIAVIEDGRILQVDDATGLYERPRSRSVAAFIGTMNFFEAIVERNEAEQIVVDGGPAGRYPAPGLALAPRTPVTFGVRPERIRLDFTAPPAGQRALKGNVIGQTYLGDRRQYCVSVAGIAAPIWAAPPLEVGSARSPASSQSDAWVSWSDDSVIILES